MLPPVPGAVPAHHPAVLAVGGGALHSPRRLRGRLLLPLGGGHVQAPQVSHTSIISTIYLEKISNQLEKLEAAKVASLVYLSLLSLTGSFLALLGLT